MHAETLLEALQAGVDSLAEKDVLATPTLGAIGDSELAKHYGKFDGEEMKQANKYRRLTVVMVFVAMGSMLIFILTPAMGWSWFELPGGD